MDLGATKSKFDSGDNYSEIWGQYGHHPTKVYHFSLFLALFPNEITTILTLSTSEGGEDGYVFLLEVPDQGVLSRADKPLPVIVFTLVINSAKHIENVTVHNIKYYFHKRYTMYYGLIMGACYLKPTLRSKRGNIQ